MLRSRTIREGSVGLLALVGIILFGGFALWLRGFRFRDTSYEIIADFPNVNGIQVGDSVRYRGLNVGQITNIQPATNGVDVTMEIYSSNLLIPKEATIQASRSGLIGQTLIDITPQEQLPPEAQAMSPLSEECNPQLIICDRDRLQGQPGVTLDDLLPVMYRLTSLYTDPQFFDNVNAAAQNASVAATEVAELSRRVIVLTDNVQQEFANFSATAQAITDAANRTTTQIETTAEQIGQLTTTTNELIVENRDTLAHTLNSISETSDRLNTLVGQFDTTVAAVDTEQLIQNLETLTANAADASASLKEISAAFSEPSSLVMLQQTLDSARATFANTQKITADLEEFTGDPAFRNNLRRLVDGLGSLVSSTEQLEQQIQTAQVLQSVPRSTNLPASTPQLSQSVDRLLGPDLFNTDGHQDRLLSQHNNSQKENVSARDFPFDSLDKRPQL
ncbi:MCE family protein [Pleurocapsales cyanobacterium LEGE 06147]|nr:MCE family protein [Pleurocapsales cyanobacterium LEGE 06147]